MLQHFSLLASSVVIESVQVVVALVAFALGVAQKPVRELVRRWLAVRRRVLTVGRYDVSDRLGSATIEMGAEHNKALAELEKTLEYLARDPIPGPCIYVSAIDIRAFRCFEDVSVKLHHRGDASQLHHPNVNLILGDNGSGKSTLLKAIAMAALAPIIDSSGFYPYHLVRSHNETATICGRFLTDAPAAAPTELEGSVEIARVGDLEKVSARYSQAAWSEIFDESNPAFLVVGYGVNRRIAGEEERGSAGEIGRRSRRYQRVASLFEESTVLTPLSTWLPTLSLSRRAEVEEILDQLLPADTSVADVMAPDTLFRSREQAVPYRALSDGYKSFIGWVGDLLFQIDTAASGKLAFTEVGGIVLVDEVDLLLHPSWQREVVTSIAEALPNLQFVFTTHSPIVAGTLESGNILIARPTKSGGSILANVDGEIYGLNAEQILLSSYFELESTRAPSAQESLGELATRAMEGDDAAAVDYLRALAGESAPPDPDG